MYIITYLEEINKHKDMLAINIFHLFINHTCFFFLTQLPTANLQTAEVLFYFNWNGHNFKDATSSYTIVWNYCKKLLFTVCGIRLWIIFKTDNFFFKKCTNFIQCLTCFLIAKNNKIWKVIFFIYSIITLTFFSISIVNHNFSN